MQVPEKKFGIWNFGTEHGLGRFVRAKDKQEPSGDDSHLELPANDDATNHLSTGVVSSFHALSNIYYINKIAFKNK